jgi:hypothetical protein
MQSRSEITHGKSALLYPVTRSYYRKGSAASLAPKGSKAIRVLSTRA